LTTRWYRAIIMLKMKRLLVIITLICFLLILTTCSNTDSQQQAESPILPTTPSPAPSVGGFIEKGSLTAANSEVVIVKLAADTFHAVTGTWPSDSHQLVTAGYLDREPEETYRFDTNSGKISGVTSSGKWITAGLVFDVKTQKWK
jgi:hypothetical protein